MKMAWVFLLTITLMAVCFPRWTRKFRKGRIMSFVVSILVISLVAYSILAWSLYFLQSSLLYHPVGEVSYDPGDLGLSYEKIVLETDDRLKLSGWFVPAKNAELTVLFCHGNAGNMAHRMDSINIFNELGLNCFIFDYRGYGNSEGKPTEEGTYVDAEVAWKWLTKDKNIPPGEIIIFGRSLGGCIAANLATKVTAKGLVIESGFTSYVDMGKKFYPYLPVGLFAKFSYNALDSVRRVHCPVMIIHSRNDELVPFEFCLQLYDGANEPKELLEIFGGHNDGFLFSGETYKQGWSSWLEFLKNYKAADKPILRIS